MALRIEQLNSLVNSEIAAFTFNANEKFPEPKSKDREILAKNLKMCTSSAIVSISLQEITNDKATEWSSFINPIFGRSHKRHEAFCGGVLMFLMVKSGFNFEIEHKEVRLGALGGKLAKKSAIGFYVRICQREFVIIGAHLKAHKENFEDHHKQLDLIFDTIKFKAPDGTMRSVADVKDVVLMGDLNFRISKKQLLSENTLLKNPDRYGDDFFSWDQLLPNKHNTALRDFKEYFDEFKYFFESKNRIGLSEKEISTIRGWAALHKKIRPTFKYVPGTVDKFSAKKIPSITDRIFYKGNLEHFLYEQLLEVEMSDHKPVYEKISIKPSEENKQMLNELN